jgi:hypothetical protein
MTTSEEGIGEPRSGAYQCLALFSGDALGPTLPVEHDLGFGNQYPQGVDHVSTSRGHPVILFTCASNLCFSCLVHYSV